MNEFPQQYTRTIFPEYPYDRIVVEEVKHHTTTFHFTIGSVTFVDAIKFRHDLATMKEADPAVFLRRKIITDGEVTIAMVEELMEWNQGDREGPAPEWCREDIERWEKKS